MPRKNIDITLPDLSGRRIILTGGSDGMGSSDVRAGVSEMIAVDRAAAQAAGAR